MNLTDKRPVVFTAQSKAFFYCRDAVCEFVFQKGAVPLNPFRVFEYFLGDRVNRDEVRQGNNTLIHLVDEVWVFGETVADGVLFEIELAKKLGKPLHYYTIDNTAKAIRPINPNKLKFESSVYTKTKLKKKDLIKRIMGQEADQLALPLPNGKDT